MKMKGAPLLYGRTYTVDFGSQFLVQPDFFTRAEAEWAFSVVSSSMDHSDFMGRDGRRVIFGNGRFIVVGLVTLFEDLFQKCGLEPVYNRLDNDHGRPAYGFIGVAVQRQDAGGLADIPSETLLDLYCETIAPIWNRAEMGRPVKVPAREVTVIEKTSEPAGDILQGISFSQKSARPAVFANDSVLCEKVCQCVLALAQDGSKITFCSDADEIREDYRKIFDVVTCVNPKRLAAVSKNNDNNSGISASSPYAGDVRGYDCVVSRDRGNRSNTADKPVQKSEKKAISQSKKALSYDDIIGSEAVEKRKKNPAYPKDTRIDQEIIRRNRASGIGGDNITLTDGVLTLGAVAGVTYCVVGAVNSANPVVLVLAGAMTLVVIGVEAKRIIDMFF